MPAFPVSVPMEFYEEIAKDCGEPFADSYLFGASLHGGKLTPRTETAWRALRDNWAVMTTIKARKIALIKPPPFKPVQRGMAA